MILKLDAIVREDYLLDYIETFSFDYYGGIVIFRSFYQNWLVIAGKDIWCLGNHPQLIWVSYIMWWGVW